MWMHSVLFRLWRTNHHPIIDDANGILTFLFKISPVLKKSCVIDHVQKSTYFVTSALLHCVFL